MPEPTIWPSGNRPQDRTGGDSDISIASKNPWFLIKSEHRALHPVGTILAILLICLTDARGAQLSAKYLECLNSKTTNAEWAGCSRLELQQQEASLQRAWEDAYKMISQISEKAAAILADEQRAWDLFK